MHHFLSVCEGFAIPSPPFLGGLLEAVDMGGLSGNLIPDLPGGTAPFLSFLVLVAKYMFTSSMAQGGGRSFRNRKPTEKKVGCCEFWMANADGRSGGLSFAFFLQNGCNSCSVHLTTTAGCSVV